MRGKILKWMDGHGDAATTIERLNRARDGIVQILLDAGGASKELINAAGETTKQVLEGVIERRRQLAAMHADRGRGRGRKFGS
jgi:hypothetical protein